MTPPDTYVIRAPCPSLILPGASNPEGTRGCNSGVTGPSLLAAVIHSVRMKWIIPLTTSLIALATACTPTDVRPDGMTIGYGHTWTGEGRSNLNGTNQVVSDPSDNDLLWVALRYDFGPDPADRWRGIDRPGVPVGTREVESPLERLPVPGRSFDPSDGTPQDPEPLEDHTEPPTEETVEGVEPDGEAEAVDVHEEVEWFNQLGLPTQLSILAVILLTLVICRRQIAAALGWALSKIPGRGGDSGSEK